MMGSLIKLGAQENKTHHSTIVNIFNDIRQIGQIETRNKFQCEWYIYHVPLLVDQEQDGFVSGRQASDGTRRFVGLI